MSSLRRRGRALVALLLPVLTVAGGLIAPLSASAVTTVFEIEGEWGAGTPNPVKSGTGLVSTWRYNVNDGDAAPQNPTYDNLTVTFTAQSARFTELPESCLTESVEPVSVIEDAGTTLVCNLGARPLGTAELVITGMQADGITGDAVTLGARVGEPGVNEVQASLPELAMNNPFAMDMQFSGGNPRLGVVQGMTQEVNFPWALRHAPGANPGPNSVSYDLRFTTTGGEVLSAAPTGCSVQNQPNPTYPYSGSGHAADRTAPFPGTCSLTLISANVFRLTLTGIDYSKAVVPTYDTSGVGLSTDWDVVAAGLVNVRFEYVNATTIAFTTSDPTYVSSANETSTGIASNNSNSRAVTRGVWTGGWYLRGMSPPADGSQWTDTYRTLAGQRVLASSGVRPPQGSETTTQVCTVLDTKYVTFESAAAGTLSGGVVSPFPGVIYEYYTGNGTNGMVNPSSPNYNPNAFECNQADLTWQSTLPADLTTVKAIRATYPAAASIPAAVATLWTYAVVKPGVAVGQDIWTWTSFQTAGFWYHQHRSMLESDKPLSGTITPGRYPYTGGGRDVLRIVAGSPKLTKSVDQAVTVPGATVNFTLNYRVEAPVSTTVQNVNLVDVLPAGLTYVPGSASVAPTSITGQRLEWMMASLETNTDYTIVLSATVDADADAGQTFRNDATVNFGGITKASSASTRIREGGYTFLTKTADQQQVPHVQGAARDGWTVRLTSADTGSQSFTDTVDILPYNGDGRGTQFSGSYALAEPVEAVAGATVYYTAADPQTIIPDPAHPSHGAAGSVAGNTIGWSTTFDPNATAVRVIGPALPAGAAQSFRIEITTEGATFGDMYVNRADARASRTELVMRTSSWFRIAAVNSIMLKKYVQDADGVWHDAQNIDDYPRFHNGDSVKYRLVVTNTGDETITNVQLSDDRFDLSAIDPLPDGLAAGAVISELLPGADNAFVLEYDLPLSGLAADEPRVNNACAVPEDTTIDESCDPAGIIALPSSLAWEKISAGAEGQPLADSEWELVRVDESQAPVGSVIAVADCIASAVDGCSGADQDPRAGFFLVNELPDGLYRLVETRAPAGYVLDPDPRYVEVEGVTALLLPIENAQAPGLTIPLTGGTGAFMFIGLAALGGGIAGLLLLLRRRFARTA